LNLGGLPNLRVIKKGYPFITENGNLIFDTSFNSPSNDVLSLERTLKCIPGVMEVGLFSKKADLYYKVKDHGDYEIIH
jgi:ribose 5-phosphate isomerase A